MSMLNVVTKNIVFIDFNLACKSISDDKKTPWFQEAMYLTKSILDVPNNTHTVAKTYIHIMEVPLSLKYFPFELR